MDPVTLACAEVPLAVVLYALRGLRHRRGRAAAERRATMLGMDPYRAAADRRWTEDDTQAAAARLLLDGLATVNDRGNLHLTPSGADPARTAGHPLPDALLTALRRRTVPATLGRIAHRDTVFGAAREDFHTAWRADLPRSGPDSGCLTAAWVLLLVGETAFSVAALLDAAPRGPLQWAAAIASGLALLAQFIWINQFGRPDVRPAESELLAEGPARTALHPALVELASREPQSWDRLKVSRRRDRGQRRPSRRTTSAPGA
ncbi:hypothetical protein I3F58_21550 [Streptomyces sp. MUM 203J]|uniref:hypothetical protein n=1 Tax=Streptomyces sp. MUM 203J TaxID=2791990 RepID=UPI001F04FF4D|nr:hypothetical protein [Streptomyces sp. MUM 203J]MCH0542099.1 hypothetical protein [Streptomyces sp. MUM 203J]